RHHHSFPTRRSSDLLFNHKYNHKRIFRLMNITGIQSVIRRKRPQYQRSTPQHITDNVLNREFTAEKPNEKWVTDVTEFKYGSSRDRKSTRLNSSHVK